MAQMASRVEISVEAMSNPLISVIVPVYNVAPWLPRCLDSICGQTYRNLEILCVNDGSTDNSGEILAEYAARDSRIRVFTQENAGLSAARNTALEHATGEWVAGVDSDDYIAPDLYERSVSCIEEGVDIVFYGVQLVSEEGTTLPSNPYFDLPENGVYEMTPELGENLNVCFWSKLWRRSILETHQLRFPHGLVHEDEAMFYLFMPRVRCMASCPAAVYSYVQRGGSIMHSGQSANETVERYARVVQYVYEQFERRGVCPARSLWYQQMINRVYTHCCYCVAESSREDVRSLYYELLEKQGVLSELKGNFLFRRIIPVRGLNRLFVRRNMSQEIWCFMGIPLFVVTYQGAHRDSSQWIIGELIFAKIQKLIRRFFQ